MHSSRNRRCCGHAQQILHDGVFFDGVGSLDVILLTLLVLLAFKLNVFLRVLSHLLPVTDFTDQMLHTMSLVFHVTLALCLYVRACVAVSYLSMD